MHITVYCLDHEGMVEKRREHYDAHKTYLATSPVRTLISGPLLALDGETMIGSFFLYESEDVDTVVRFNRDDPFNRAGIWRTVEVRPFLKRVDNRYS
ncbi:YciI family protein [Paraburkholderia sp. SIMBA_054]|uniref:YciI family protein n=1 Tax=Paraburkholderia sp. SIMBA_054 TaxID=3085795 RepID=UPI00397A409C